MVSILPKKRSKAGFGDLYPNGTKNPNNIIKTGCSLEQKQLQSIYCIPFYPEHNIRNNIQV